MVDIFAGRGDGGGATSYSASQLTAASMACHMSARVPLPTHAGGNCADLYFRPKRASIRHGLLRSWLLR